MQKRLFYLVVFFLGSIFSWQSNFSQAQETQGGFLIDPFFQEVEIQKEQSSSPFSIEVKNTTENPAVFRVSVLDFGTLNETGGVAFLGSGDDLKYRLASWVKLENDTLVLDPGEAKKVKGQIENRESLAPGGHYGAVFLKIEGGENAIVQPDQVAFNPSMASLLFVRKIGGEVYGIELKEKEFNNNLFKLSDSVKLRFQNSGNVHNVPRGTVEISDPFGRPVRKSVINPESTIVLPQAVRVFSSKFIPLATAFVPGTYAAKINYRYEGLDIFADQSQTFLFIPPLFILAVIALLALLIFCVRFWIRRKRK